MRRNDWETSSKVFLVQFLRFNVLLDIFRNTQMMQKCIRIKNYVEFSDVMKYIAAATLRVLKLVTLHDMYLLQYFDQVYMYS